MSISVVVADDHRLLRDSLRSSLEDGGMRVVGEAGDGREAVAVTVACRPRVVLMDVTMPVLDGIAATRELRHAAPGTRVVILTMHDDRDVVDRARRAGATGFLLKDAGLDEVVAAVRRAATGALVLGSGVGGMGRWVEERAAAVAGTGDRPVLSERESQILQLAADGVGTSATAERLVLSPKTVRNHLSRIYDKLGVCSRAEAIVAGFRLGVIRLD